MGLPTLAKLKVELYSTMLGLKLRPADLAQRLGWTASRVTRLLDLNHDSRVDQLEKALEALGNLQ